MIIKTFDGGGMKILPECNETKFGENVDSVIKGY